MAKLFMSQSEIRDLERIEDNLIRKGVPERKARFLAEEQLERRRARKHKMALFKNGN